MRFIGSIPAKVKNILAAELSHFKGEKFQIIASGSFKLEQVLSKVTDEIYSNDIGLLSVVYGDYILNKKRALELNNDDLIDIEDYLNTSPLNNAAAVVTAYQAGEFSKKNNLTNIKRYKYIIQHIDKIFNNNKKLIEEKFGNVRMKDMYVEDALNVIQRTDDKIMISFLPTYTGGYEKIYGYLDLSFSWKDPEFTMIDDDLYVDWNTQILEKGGIVYTDRDIPSLEKYKRAFIELGAGSKPINIYSSVDFKNQVYINHVNMENPNYPYMPDDFEITDNTELSIKPLSVKQFEYYRNVYIAKDKVKVFGTGDNYGLFLDSKIFGFISYKQTAGKDMMMLLSDFIINNRKYKRLSKLVIMAAKCSEMRTLLQIKNKNIFDYIMTKVYTKKPVSMKYRGEWKKTLRDETSLSYKASFGYLTLKEEFEKWKRKHKNK